MTIPLALMITGHRPSKLGGYRPCPQHDRIRQALIALLETSRSLGFAVTGISGMALGVDQFFAEACLTTHTPFHAYVPFEGQESCWPASSQASYQALLRQAERVVVVGPKPVLKPAIAQALHARNQRMVEACQAAIAVWDGSPGGTADAVRRITLARRPCVRLDPMTPTVSPAILARWFADLRHLS